MAEFREMQSSDDDDPGEGPSRVAERPERFVLWRLNGICRFCGTRLRNGFPATDNVCDNEVCQEYGRDACNRVLGCGHLCGGIRDELSCLPCLFGCAAGDNDGFDADMAGPSNAPAPLRQDADDMCMICCTDPLEAAPAIQLTCGHVFHYRCCKHILIGEWIGQRIKFTFSQCPICMKTMNHWSLEELLQPIRQLYEEVKSKALMRLEHEGLASPTNSQARVQPESGTYAMDRYAYYVCYRCGKAYYGGLARDMVDEDCLWDPPDLVCGACSDIAGAMMCPNHGSEFLEYKCRYCCSVAAFFCFGTTHFCNLCHEDIQRMVNIPSHLLPQCPAGPKGEQLPGTQDDCPLHVQHPPTGEEFALGCGMCRNAHDF